MKEADKDLVKLLRGRMLEFEYSMNDIVKLSGLKRTLVYSRFQDPSKFRIKELRTICKCLEVPPEQAGRYLGNW